MTARTVRRALLARLGRTSDERGSIPMLMLVMIATAALGGILLSSIVSQVKTTRFDQTRVHALHAAQTGIDLVLGQIRTAVGTDRTSGDDGKLPCGPWTGNSDNNGAATYTAKIRYFMINPRGLTDTQLDSFKIGCTSAGPYDSASASRTPRYAVITSNGVDGTTGNGASNGRTLEATYVFQTNDVNISGGQIRIYPAGGSQWCMDAGATPAVGTAVKLQACSTSSPPADQQVWAYRSDLSIELVSSAKTATPLCIDTSPTSHTAGVAIVLKRCTVPDASVCPAGTTTGCSVSPSNQQWSVDDNAHLEGARTDQSDIDGYCINVASQATGVALTLANCVGGTTDTSQTWVPSPTTGAGMAGAGNQQLVNYKQFAMCLDITGQQVSSTFLILYTCKQNPEPTKVKWNQKFTPSPALGLGPTKVLLKVVTDSTASPANTTYCLKSPRTAGGYPVLSTPCPSSVATAGPGFAWTVNQKYTDASKSSELSYADKYTIHDDSPTSPAGGLCLGPGQNSDLHLSEYYKAIVSSCDGSTAQKWNADPSLDASTVTNTHETT